MNIFAKYVVRDGKKAVCRKRTAFSKDIRYAKINILRQEGGIPGIGSTEQNKNFVQLRGEITAIGTEKLALQAMQKLHIFRVVLRLACVIDLCMELLCTSELYFSSAKHRRNRRAISALMMCGRRFSRLQYGVELSQ